MINYNLFDSLLEPVFILNKNQELVYCNETAAVIADSTVRKMTRGGKKLSEFITFSEPIDWLEHLQNVKESTPYKEINFTNHSGQAGKVQITCQLIKDDFENSHWITFIRDVTLEERLQKKYRGELEQKEDVILQLQKAQVELQNYSKNLEKMVEERTLEISSLNRTMTALLDSLKQGFFLFDASGKCLPVSSKACATTIETDPRGRFIWEVFKISENKVESFKKWMHTIFSEMLPFEDLAPLGPSEFNHSLKLKIKLDYFPLRAEDKSLKAIVVVATDITDLVQAQKEAEEEKFKVQKILNMVQNKKHLQSFFKESNDLMHVLKDQIQRFNENFNIELTQRALHTLKGNASLYSLQGVSSASHSAESFISEKPKELWLEKLISTSDKIQSELQLYKNEVQDVLGEHVLSSDRRIELPQSELLHITNALRLWSKGQYLAENIYKKYFFEPVHTFFEPFNEIILKTAYSLQKEMLPLETHGENILVNPQLVANFFSVLVHCFRNSVDHGIEMPDARESSGKARAGKISIETEVLQLDQKDHFKILIQDDGGGINIERVKNKLKANGLVVENETDEQIIQHIFDPSFSTKEQVTEISGRGVGLDAVKSVVTNMQGHVKVYSQLGQFTRFEFIFPLEAFTKKTELMTQSSQRAEAA